MEKGPYRKQSGRLTTNPVVETIRQAAETDDPEKREKAEREARRAMTGMYPTVDKSGTGWDSSQNKRESNL